MARPKTRTYFPPTHSPQGFDLCMRDANGGLTSTKARAIERLLSNKQFRIGLSRSQELGFKFVEFTPSQLGQLLVGLEDAIDLHDMENASTILSDHSKTVAIFKLPQPNLTLRSKPILHRPQ